MAKTSIANPVVVLSLDANPFTAGLEKAKATGSAASKEIAAATKVAATAASAAAKAATDIAAKGVAADVAAAVAATKAKVAAEVAAVAAITKAKLQADAGALAAAKTKVAADTAALATATKAKAASDNSALAITKAKVASEVAAVAAVTKAKVSADAAAITAAAKAAALAANPPKPRGGIISGAAGAVRGAIGSTFMPIIAANQAMEFGNKISKVLGAPMRALMGREQLQAQFAGTGTIDPTTSTTFTAGIARFGAAFDSMLADIAEDLDRTFDLRGILEYARGALTGISTLLTTFFGNLEPIIKDPEALTKQFKAGALMVVNVFEWVANAVKDTFKWVFDGLAKVGFNFDKFAGIMRDIMASWPAKIARAPGAIEDFGAWALAAAVPVGLGGEALRRGVAKGPKERRPEAVKPLVFGEVPNIAQIAANAKAAINALGVGPDGALPETEKQKAERLMRQAGVIMGKIGGNLMPQITSKIAPLMVSGSAQLEDALVKAQLQGEAGDVQQRIEAAIKEQLDLQKKQVRTLDKIRDLIALPGNDKLAAFGNNS